MVWWLVVRWGAVSCGGMGREVGSVGWGRGMGCR